MCWFRDVVVMGMGKTLTTISFVECYLREALGTHIMIITPGLAPLLPPPPLQWLSVR